MSELVSVRQHKDSNTVVTVTRSVAEAKGLEVLDQPATDKRGRGLAPRPLNVPSELKGQALEDALDAAGLPKTGSADDKRARLAEAANQKENA